MKIKIVEYDHAILVRGTSSVRAARRALKREGYNKEARRLPCRPFFDPNLGGDCVGFYFEMGND